MYCSVAARIYVKISFLSCLSNVSANFMDEIVCYWQNMNIYFYLQWKINLFKIVNEYVS